MTQAGVHQKESWSILKPALFPWAVLCVVWAGYLGDNLLLIFPATIALAPVLVFSFIRWFRIRRPACGRARVLGLSLVAASLAGSVSLYLIGKQYFGTPSRFLPEHLVNRTAAEIARELGQPDSDSRVDDPGGSEFAFCYTYGLGMGHGRICRIEFDASGKAATVRNFDK